MQWIAAWQTSDTTMKVMVKSTVRGESVDSMEQPDSRSLATSVRRDTSQKYDCASAKALYCFNL